MFLETSAKTAYNVKEAFDLSAQAILRDVDSNSVDMNNDPNVILLLLIRIFYIEIEIKYRNTRNRQQ